MDSIRERLKYIRKMQDMNQQQFSNRIGISQGRLSELELGKTYPSTDTLISISSQFKVDLNGLLLGKDKNNSFASLSKEIEFLLSKLSVDAKEEVLSFIKFKLREL
ncbi:helix-turn-helix domain-containing protein [Paenibacillus alkaliterrae]|uniref:helix-turn-helix domain-containing protein n=1 Tax=Paenibacillus alkaliterrae TaxID=320909 RepID=UPI001F2434EC|nr:helix-turn-helix transcriptional regulator [Paenibacillus alkaliterrae]MCF2941674.1 helix-turn-helix domain-containing protein [Paenibacillus alkaliterrae]